MRDNNKRRNCGSKRLQRKALLRMARGKEALKKKLAAKGIIVVPAEAVKVPGEVVEVAVKGVLPKGYGAGKKMAGVRLPHKLGKFGKPPRRKGFIDPRIPLANGGCRFMPPEVSSLTDGVQVFAEPIGVDREFLPRVPFGGIDTGTKVMCSISTGGARRGISHIGRNTSFGPMVAAMGAKLDKKKAKAAVKPVFGDLDFPSGDGYYNEVISLLYVYFSSRQHNLIELSLQQIYFHSKYNADDFVFDFDVYDAFTVLQGLLSLHTLYHDAWKLPDDEIKNNNLVNFLLKTFPRKRQEIEKLVSETKDVEHEGNNEEEEGARIPLEVSPTFKRPEGLPVRGLCDILMSENNESYLSCLDRVLYEVILPHVWFHKSVKGCERWNWVAVRVAMMRCRIFNKYSGRLLDYLPDGAVFSRVMCIMMSSHEGVAYSDDKDWGIEISVNGMHKKFKRKVLTDETNKGSITSINEIPQAPNVMVGHIVKSLREYNLDFSGGTSLDGIVV